MMDLLRLPTPVVVAVDGVLIRTKDDERRCLNLSLPPPDCRRRRMPTGGRLRHWRRHLQLHFLHAGEQLWPLLLNAGSAAGQGSAKVVRSGR